MKPLLGATEMTTRTAMTKKANALVVPTSTPRWYLILTFHVKDKRSVSPCNQFLIMRWLKTGGEMHYLPLSKLQQRHTEVVDNTPAVFLPTKILELTCKVFSYGVEIILPCILFISWCTEEDVKVFHKDFQKKTINHVLMTSRMFQLFLQLGWYETEV